MIDELTTVIAIDSLGQVRNIAMSFFKDQQEYGCGHCSDKRERPTLSRWLVNDNVRARL
ncbi:hypothetical protein [Arcanobacterium haemolyticum]